MKKEFSASARKLAGIATRMFGWPPDTFWATTPAEFAAIFTTDNAGGDASINRSELAALMERDAHG